MARFDINTLKLIPESTRTTLHDMILREIDNDDFLSFVKLNQPIFHVDQSIDFYAQHFSKNRLDWAYYHSTNRTKAGTLRYKDERIRVPTSTIMQVYETFPGRNEKEKRGLVQIPRIIIANLEELTTDELLNDGFSSVKEAVKNMGQYPGYEKISEESMVSYYHFGKITWTK